ncbi:unnamed protein product, partial [Hydatigera taeniaeformis]|uniref:EF-hand domain-containing protein n=1 Tax=Hydatigena taeniaeformis TaxID=6205 RepID=A0A0R3X4H8_HYDTA
AYVGSAYGLFQKPFFHAVCDGTYYELFRCNTPFLFHLINTSKYDQHFRRFASREYSGVLYMTPNDFLQSLFQEKPPCTFYLKKILEKSVRCGSSDLFRKLGNQGLISFTDYLFLLGLLNKPSSRFEVAFNVLDADSNGEIDADEFSLVRVIVSNLYSNQLYGVSAGVPSQMQSSHDHLSLFSTVSSSHRFVENLQDEILEVEFTLSSSNGVTISPTNFARVLLHNTDLPESRYDEFLSRLSRLPTDTEITLEDFKGFYKFMNHLDDFRMAMKMYTLANRPISQAEFRQAIRVCANLEIGDQALQTLFCMFDSDGDGHISPEEFMVLFRNIGIWEDYKKCVGRAIREY